jgi:putative nucleotidyltransferase with HDIG domain
MAMLDQNALTQAAVALDPLPATVSRLAALVVREDWSVADAAHLVEFDPPLTGRLLEMANSAATAGLASVSTVREAILRVGIGPVLAFATASGLKKELKRALPEYGLSEGQLWRHAVASALAAEMLSGPSRTALPPEVFTAALLHDVGKIVLARFLDAERLRRLAEARQEGGASSIDAELEVLGASHAALGARIAAHWALPPRIATGIAHHHAPEDGRDVVCDAVYLANIAAKRIGEGISVDERDLVPDLAVLDRLGLTLADWDAVCAELPAEFQATLQKYAWD